MDELGWDTCDIIIVTGDAYVDHPSFGMAIIGRFLESQGFRVGIIAQPDWSSAEDFKKLGKPNLFYGVTAGNMDSMINRYTADLKVRNDDAYTPNAEAGKRPDRAAIVYSQRCKEAFSEVPVVLGGIEASLRRVAQYDYWSNEVRRSVLVDATADILLYGNAERAMAEVATKLAGGASVNDIQDIRGTVVVKPAIDKSWVEIDSTRIDWPKDIASLEEAYGGSPYECRDESECSGQEEEAPKPPRIVPKPPRIVPKPLRIVPKPLRIVPMPLQSRVKADNEQCYIRLPSFEKVRKDPALYAHTSRVVHQESNPLNARVLVQKHGNRELWINPPPLPLETPEIDGLFGLFFQRRPHPSYGKAKIPAYDMIKTSVNIMRGCFGGCSFCSITEHEGRIIQSRSQESIIAELEDLRDKVPGFTGQISDLGGPSANMYRLGCKRPEVQAQCRRLSCVFPGICKNLETSHVHTTELYRKARAVPGIKKIAIASGLRYDLAVRDPEYVKELVTYHVGGYLKIAPEHSERNTLDMMMKPGIGTYYEFKKMFDHYSREAGKEQYLIPYFIAAHPGCEDEDMLNLSLWLKQNNFRVDQVQTFYPSPMSLATTMYHGERNPLKKVTYKSDKLYTAKEYNQRRLHKAFLRYHDPKSHSVIREALIAMNRSDLIGHGKKQLVPEEQKQGYGRKKPAGANSGSFNKARGGQWDNRKPVRKKPVRKPAKRR